jgi:tRNA1Val (adenine37-N6)-methyltransferase
MSNTWFQFKQFKINQERAAMKVTTDACLFGAWAASLIAKHEKEKIFYHILDIGAGTGLLGLMIAQQSKAGIDSVEIDPAAAAEADANYKASPWYDRLFVMPGDARDYTHTFGKAYNAIVSNPPFYENELAGADPRRNQAHHDGGLRIGELFGIITDLLQPGAPFYVLLPYKRLAEIPALMDEYGLLLTKQVLVRQSTRHDFFRIMLEGRKIGDDVENFIATEMAIKDGDDYTPEFVSLLKDYYLYL